jgi:hypothetical protein
LHKYNSCCNKYKADAEKLKRVGSNLKLKKMKKVLLSNLLCFMISGFVFSQTNVVLNKYPLSAYSSTGIYSVASATDASSSTYAYFNNDNLVLTYDLNQSYYIDHPNGDLRITADCGSITIEASTNLTTWTLLVNVVSYTPGSIITKTFDASGNYRYFRFTVKKYYGNPAQLRIYDIQIYGAASPVTGYYSKLGINTSDLTYILNVRGSIGAGSRIDLDNPTFIIDPNGTSTLDILRTRIYSDKDNTDYYLDPNNSGVSLKVAGKIESEEIEIKEMSSNHIKTRTIQADEMNLKTDKMADFVFEDTYVLPSLLQIEQYVNENKHLPGIPSANEVKEKGMDVAEMNMILLQKIEEMTLYLIEIKKENEWLKNEIRNVKN